MIAICVSIVLLSVIYKQVDCGYPFTNTRRSFECGPYGFVCEGNRKIRLCEGSNLFGPAFLCPANTVCDEDSSNVCENNYNFIDPSSSKIIRCRRNERLADPSVPNCKGYILCTPNKKGSFQGIKFQCSGNTIFNGYSRTCSAPNKYKCPISNVTTPPPPKLYEEDSRNYNYDRIDSEYSRIPYKNMACKNYKFKVIEEGIRNKVAYFCPQRPMRGETLIRCTVFSNDFCLTLVRDDEDQFTKNVGVANRRPRIMSPMK